MYPREEHAGSREWWASRVGHLLRWPWFPVPVWILLPVVFLLVTAPVAAAASALAWFAFGVPIWPAWLLVDAGLLGYIGYGLMRFRRLHGRGPRPPHRRPPDGGVREPRSPRGPRPSLSSAVDPDDPAAGHAPGTVL